MKSASIQFAWGGEEGMQNTL